MSVNDKKTGWLWSKELTERLMLLWAEGWTATHIAKALGTTRNAVSGKAHRIGLRLPDKQRPPKPVPEPRPKTVKARAPGLLPVRVPRELFPEPIVEVTEPVPFLERRDFHCAAILNERGADGLAMVCGNRALPLRSWCAKHFHLYTEPPKGPPHGKASYRLQ
jgi:hypothetical protein